MDDIALILRVDGADIDVRCAYADAHRVDNSVELF
jgi:hypothetical protein